MRFLPFVLVLLAATATAQPVPVPPASAPAPADTTESATDAPARLYIQDGVVRVDTTGEGLRLSPLVITATRTARALEDVPVPTTVLTDEEIAAQGAVRLSDLLSEEPGLVTTESFLGGTGLQLQGFDADYTLVLRDGEPVVGRAAGTLDLDRLSVTNVDRVEVVRGPLSSRFGPDALAGVVNVVTRPPGETTGGRLSARAESHGTSDLSAEAETGNGLWGARLSLNRFAADPDLVGRTLPTFTDQSAELRARFNPTASTDVGLSARYSGMEQSGPAVIGGLISEEQQRRTDWSLRPSVTHRFSSRLRTEASVYASNYRNEWTALVPETGEVFSDPAFSFDYQKAEATVTALPSQQVVLHVGGGGIRERVGGERYPEPRTATQGFVFTEMEWLPSRLVDVVLSARFDAPSDYAARVTPKAAVLVRPMDRLRLRGSIGSGYRAPDFRQRYLSFFNPAGGYQLFGAEEAPALLQGFADAGDLTWLIPDPSVVQSLRAESSVAFGAGIEADLPANVSVRLNAFHNEVRDLIDARLVAQRPSNGQQLFTYLNAERIYTRGIEADARWRTALPVGLGGLSVQLGYQLLDTADRDVLDQIEAGTLFVREPGGRDVRVTRSEYGGLFGRSRHSSTLRLSHTLDGFTTTARVVYRSRYGFAENLGPAAGGGSTRPLVRDSQYAPGFAMVNVTTTKALGRADLTLGVRNLFDYTDATYLPAQPGRVVFAGVGVRF